MRFTVGVKNKKFFILSSLTLLLVVLLYFLCCKPQKVQSYVIPTFRVCVRVNGQQINPNVYGVIQYRDKHRNDCYSGNTRYLELGRTEIPHGASVSIAHNGHGCAEFYPWLSFSNSQRNWLYNNRVSVPGIGNERRSPFAGASSFGCSEAPLFFSAFIDGYQCSNCVRYNHFSNNGGMRAIIINCTPINQPPTVRIQSLPQGCFESASKDGYEFEIHANDQDGASDVNQLKLDIGGHIFTVNINGGVFNIVNNRAGPLLAQFRSGQVWQNSVRLNMFITGLKSLSGNVPVRVWAQDRAGLSSGWADQGAFNIILRPVINEFSFNPESIVLSPSGPNFSTLRWDTDSGNSSNATCTITMTSGCEPTNLSCTPGTTGSGTINVTATSRGACVATLNIRNNECGGGGRAINLVFTEPQPQQDAWMNTAFGDTYAYEGYKTASSLELRDLSDSLKDKLNIEYDNPAFFSHYLISKFEGGHFPTPAGRESLRNYLLNNYNDGNRDPLSTGDFAIYDYLEGLALKNSCTTGNISTGCPDDAGDYVYFVDSPVTIDSNWNRQRRIDRSCVVIASGDITVQASVNELDAFFFTEGRFETQTAGAGSDSTLIINGGVIANTVEFNRSLSDNSVDPAEIISYDPKYLERLRECLGQNYDLNISEWMYSTR